MTRLNLADSLGNADVVFRSPMAITPHLRQYGACSCQMWEGGFNGGYNEIRLPTLFIVVESLFN